MSQVRILAKERQTTGSTLLAFEMEKSRGKPMVAMYAGCGSGTKPFLPSLELARRLSIDYGFSVLFITHEKDIPDSLKQYILRVVCSCNGAMAVLQVDSAEQIRSHLEVFRNHRYPLCAYVVDSMWTKSPQLVRYHVNLGTGIGIPTYIFFSESASFVCLALLREKQHQGVTVIRVPGLPSIAPNEVPAAFLAEKFPDEQIPLASALSAVRGIIINSVRALESAQVDALISEMALPSIYPIGPLMPSWRRLPEFLQGSATGQAEEFLNRQSERSVLFVYFDSFLLSDRQIRELAVGLEASGQRFLWALKAESYSSELLPEGFQDRTKDRGLIIFLSPPQGYILAHPSTGGFVTHCGWNSTLQSILHGVPIIVLPLFDNLEKLNALVLLREMEAAIEANKGVDGLVSAKEVERCAKALMGDEGIGIRARTTFLSFEAKFATTFSGSSQEAFVSLTAAFNSNIAVRQS